MPASWAVIARPWYDDLALIKKRAPGGVLAAIQLITRTSSGVT